MILLIVLTASIWLAGHTVPMLADDTRPRVVASFDEMPKVVTLPAGRLMAFFHSLRTDVTEMREAAARTSDDDGRTWGDLKNLFPLPVDQGGFGYTLPFSDLSGEQHLFLLCDANTGQVRPLKGPRPPNLGPHGRLDIWHARTTNGGRTWMPPRRIWEGRAGDMQSVIQLKSGRILLPISYWVPRTWANRGEGFEAFTFLGSFRSSAIYSDDGGSTWRRSPAELKVPTPAIGDLGAIEPVVIQLKDGRVWMLIRTQVGRFYESFSSDGVEWTPPVPSKLESSDSPAGLIRLADGRILLLVNHCQRWPYANGGRQVLHAAVSRDEGRTWQGWREVIRDPLRNEPPPPDGDHGVSYPYPTLTRDGKVVFSMWVQTGPKRFLVQLDPKWLDETRQTADFSNRMDEWSIFGTKGVEFRSHPAAPDKKVLLVSKTQSDWPAGAVWNFPRGSRGRLQMRLRLMPGHRDFLIGLTDHFSAPFDDQDEFYNLYNLRINTDGRSSAGTVVEAGRWHVLEFRWDTRRQECRVFLDGSAAGAIPQTRISPGVNYVRIRSLAVGRGDPGLLVESAEADVTPD